MKLVYREETYNLTRIPKNLVYVTFGPIVEFYIKNMKIRIKLLDYFEDLGD